MDLTKAFQAAGLRARKPLAAKTRQQLFSRLGGPIPPEVEAFYEQCNGGRIAALACRFYPLSEAVETAGYYDFKTSLRILPFFVSEENESDPCVVGLEPPLTGYVFLLCHDGDSRVLAPSLSSFLESLASQEADEHFRLEDAMFVYPKALSQAERKTVEDLLARSRMDLEVYDERGLLVELARSMPADTERASVLGEPEAARTQAPRPPAPARVAPVMSNRPAPVKAPDFVNPTDGYEMVLIPAGKAIFGSNDERFTRSERQFEAELPAYYLGQYCVTNAQYQQFVEATGHRPPETYGSFKTVWDEGRVPDDQADHPVFLVTWDDAYAYCEGAGLRLPTELEWQKGARGTDGRLYPWGNDWEPDKCRHGGNRGTESTCAVWEYPAGVSPYGCYNMAGNVEEWLADWEEAGAYRRYSRGDLSVPAKGRVKMCSAGDWRRLNADDFLVPRRRGFEPSLRIDMRGFRCARDV
jgi:formylglycine-generating enzyme required for sulfatase activity